jgi:hypothetical protein
MSAPFAVVMLVGPGTKEIERAKDTIESLATYEPGHFVLFLVDDVFAGRSLVETLSSHAKGQIVYLTNPRKGKGSGWGSGAAAGVLAALKQISENQSFEFVLKMDTDTLIINQFSERIAARFGELPKVGILGAYQFSPARFKDRTSAPALEKLLRQVTIWRRTPAGGPAIQLALLGKYRRIRNIIQQAILNGYRLGEHCSGGGYAISKSCLVSMRQAGLLDQPTLWLQAPLGEDTIIALSATSVDFGVQGFEASGDPFAVKHFGLPDTPEQLVQRGHSIIHSVKDHGGWREEEIRGYFRARRVNTGEFLPDVRAIPPPTASR